jgi:hypothetical protein
MRRFMTALAVAAALVAAGCGDDDDGGSGGDGGSDVAEDEGAVREGLTAYADAFPANDAKAACEAMTETAQEASAEEIPGSDDCEEAHETVFKTLGSAKREQFAEQFGKAEFDAKIDGETAELTSPKAPNEPVEMRLDGDEWKLDENLLFFNPN